MHSFHLRFIRLIRPSVLISSPCLQSPFKISSAFITSKALRDPSVEKPKPWPYETRKFNYLHSYLDYTVKRFDENTKVIVVDGNIGAGKTTLARKLAEEFDFKFIPEPTMDRYYITHSGYDLREIDELMPPTYKACDLKTFYDNPKHQNVARFQYQMFLARCEDYIDALAHVLNTGQGVICDRSIFSDFVFMETMYKAGYVSQRARDLYNDMRKAIIQHLLRPHIIIYLDVPVEIIMERIKARNNPIEVNSEVLSNDYLQSLEDIYKNEYLKNFSEHAELLIYDWSHHGDAEVVVEDIEHLDLEHYGIYDTKLVDWRGKDHWEWCYFRRMYTSRKHRLMLKTRIFRYDVSEACHPYDEYLEYNELLERVPGMKYAPGFNADMGDSYLFKLQAK